MIFLDAWSSLRCNDGNTISSRGSAMLSARFWHLATAFTILVPAAMAQEEPRLWDPQGIWLVGYNNDVAEEIKATQEQRNLAKTAYGSTRRLSKEDARSYIDRFL